MQNPMRGEVALGDYTLAFDFNVMCMLEQQTGLKTGELLQMMETELGFTELRSFVWAGLQTKHPATTLTEAGNIIGGVGIEPALKAVGDALTAFLAPAKEEKGTRPPKAK